MATNSSASRQQNTRNEVRFLASAYYDCAVFVHNSGFSDINIVNRQFESMLNNYISAGKIKRESYNKFKRIIDQVSSKSFGGAKDKFIKIVMDYFDSGDAVENRFQGNNFEKEFYQLLDKYGMSDGPKIYRSVAFAQLLRNLAQIYDSTALENYFNTVVSRDVLGAVQFDNPRIVTYDDGCSGGKRYGSVFDNPDIFETTRRTTIKARNAMC